MTSETPSETPSETTETHVVYFSTSGDFITGHFRDLVMEGAWVRAVQGLVESLHGFTHEHAHLVLSGAMRLVGVAKHGDDSDPLRLTEDRNDEERAQTAAYLKQCSWLYAGIFRDGERYFRPYAFVDAWNAQDFYETVQEGQYRDLPVRSFIREVNRVRSTHYADNPREDRCEILREDGAEYDPFAHAPLVWDKEKKVLTSPLVRHHMVLFKRCDPPPLWMTPCETPAEAWKANVRRLDRRGANDEVLGWRKSTEAAELATWNQDALEDEEQVTAADLRPDKDHPESIEAHKLLMEMVDAEFEARSSSRALWIASMRAAVLAQSKEKLTVSWEAKRLPDGTDFPAGTLTIPKEPFVCYTLRRTDGRHLMPDWEWCSPSGMKMPSDDPYHTDWMLGATVNAEGLSPAMSLDDWYKEGHTPMKSAVWRLQGEIQREYLAFGDAVVLCGSGKVEGHVVQPEPDTEVEPGSIVVIPHAGPEFYMAAVTAHRKGGAVIAETGGKLSHLAVVGTEGGFRLLVVEDALKRFPKGSKVFVNASRGTVFLADDSGYRPDGVLEDE